MNRLWGPLAAAAMAQALVAQAQIAPPPAPPDTSVQGLVVTAPRPKTETRIDRTIYSVASDLQATTGSAADVLNTIPSINVDPDGALTLRGDGGVTILIDGKLSSQFTGAAQGLSLLQFPASEIDRIEVLTSPPAQYKADGSSGVINIITKKSRKAGLSGTARASVGDHGRYILGVDGADNFGPLKLSGGLGLRRDIRERLTSTDRTELDPGAGLPVASRERIDEHFHRLTPSAHFAVDDDLNSRQSIGGAFSFRDLTGHRFFDQSDQSGPPGAPISSLSDRHSDGHEVHLEAGGSAHFTQKLWRPDETLTLTVARSLTRERERYAYTDTFPLPAAPVAFSDLHLALDLVTTELSADYDLQTADGRALKFGYDLEVDDNDFDNRGDDIAPVTGVATADPNVTNEFRYRQRVNALYGQYETPLGAWRLQAGVRVEASQARWRLITGDIPGGREDLGAYPSLHLDRPLGENGKLIASIARRITRPDPEALNPFADHQDTRNLRAGNPNLAPQDTWLYELGYDFTGRPITFGLTAYYRFDRDRVTDIIEPVSADVVLITKANLPKTRAAGVDFHAGGKLGSRLSYTLAGNAFYSQIDATALGFPGLGSTLGVDLKASLDYRPTKADTLQLSLSRSDKRLTPQGRVGAIDLVNLGYRRALRANLSLVATATDVLNGQRFNRLVDTPTLVDDYTRDQAGQVVLVGFIYSFGRAPKTKSPGFDYDK